MHAQQQERTWRIGYLAPASIPHLIEALRGGLRDLDYGEGQNIAIEYGFALGQSKPYVRTMNSNAQRAAAVVLYLMMTTTIKK